MPNVPNVSDSARVLAKGATVTLKDGSTQSLVFDFEAIGMIEDLYGSLEDFTAALKGEGANKKRFTAIKNAMAATLIHTGMTPAQIVKLLDFKQFEHYLEALTSAFYEAMPEGMAEPPLVESDPASASPGATSTGPPPSTLAAVTSNSSG